MRVVAIEIGAFQSTLSMRRETRAVSTTLSAMHSSIHALHEESDSPEQAMSENAQISIHALHEESDPGLQVRYHRRDDFNPRSP